MISKIQYICFLVAFGLILAIFSRCVPADYGRTFSLYSQTDDDGENGSRNGNRSEDRDRDRSRDRLDPNDPDDRDLGDPDNDDDDGEKTTKPYGDGTDLPYSMTLNMITLNSCDTDHLDDNFNFRVASTYRPGGIGLEPFILREDLSKSEIEEDFPYHEAQPFLGFVEDYDNEPNVVVGLEHWPKNGGKDFDSGRNYKLGNKLRTLIKNGTEYAINIGHISGRSHDPISVSFKIDSSALVLGRGGFADFNNGNVEKLLVGFRNYENQNLVYVSELDDQEYIHGRYFDIRLENKKFWKGSGTNEVLALDQVIETNPRNEYDGDSFLEWNCIFTDGLEIRRHEDVIEDSLESLRDRFNGSGKDSLLNVIGTESEQEELITLLMEAFGYEGDENWDEIDELPKGKVENDFNLGKFERTCGAEAEDSDNIYYPIVKKMIDPEDQWHISIKSRCVSPKRPSKNRCYDDSQDRSHNKVYRVITNKIVNICENLNEKPCFTENSEERGWNFKTCPQVVSFCIRSADHLEKYLCDGRKRHWQCGGDSPPADLCTNSEESKNSPIR